MQQQAPHRIPEAEPLRDVTGWSFGLFRSRAHVSSRPATRPEPCGGRARAGHPDAKYGLAAAGTGRRRTVATLKERAYSQLRHG